MQAIMIGLDMAKSVFQVHGVDASGGSWFRSGCARSEVTSSSAKLPPALVGMEACGSAHYWGRKLRALGHEVRLIPAAYVKAFVQRNKTDARDAAAICAAVERPDMRLRADQDRGAAGVRGRCSGRAICWCASARQLRTACAAMLYELGVIAAQGARGFAELASASTADDPAIPSAAAAALQAAARPDGRGCTTAIAALEAQIVAAAKADPATRRLATIPGVGCLTAHAVIAAIGDGPAVRLGARLRRLGRPDPARARHRRQAPRAGHQPAGRQPACASCSCSAPAPSCATPARIRRTRHRLAARHARPAAREGGRRRPGRQDRPHPLGGAHFRQYLRAAARPTLPHATQAHVTSSFDPNPVQHRSKEPKAARQNGQDLGRDTPLRHRAISSAPECWEPDPRNPSGQRSCRPHSTGRIHDRSRPFAETAKSPLPKRGPSIHDDPVRRKCNSF